MNQGLTETVKTIEGLVDILGELLYGMENQLIFHSLVLSLKMTFHKYSVIVLIFLC